MHDKAPPAFFLEQNGFEDLAYFSSGVGTIPKMLEAGRVDAWFSEVSLIAFGIQGTSLQGKVKCGPEVLKVWQYIAGSKALSKETVDAYRVVIEDMKKEGAIEDIMLRYLPKESLKPFD